MQKQKRLRAFWVGGPPGQSLLRIVDKLAADRIDVVAAANEGRIPNAPPANIDVVLCNMEMVDPTTAARMRAKCGDAITFVPVHTSYTRTREVLVRYRLISDPSATPLVPTFTLPTGPKK